MKVIGSEINLKIILVAAVLTVITYFLASFMGFLQVTFPTIEPQYWFIIPFISYIFVLSYAYKS